MNTAFKQVGLLTLIAFVLHIIWENTQAPLFQGYQSFLQHLPVCSVGTVGDIIFTLLVYVFVSFLKKDWHWITRLNRKDIFVLTVIGFFFAVGIEQRALLFERWSYAEAMPLVPYLKVGLTPILQMTFLLPLSIYLTKKFSHAAE